MYSIVFPSKTNSKACKTAFLQGIDNFQIYSSQKTVYLLNFIMPFPFHARFWHYLLNSTV